MSHLLDVNVLLAAAWRNHSQHTEVEAWLKGKTVTVCPIAELGFLRVSTNSKAVNAAMADARSALEAFLSRAKARRIPDDLPALESKPRKSEEVTDHYLADLAQKHGLKLATFDAGIKHRAIELIA